MFPNSTRILPHYITLRLNIGLTNDVKIRLWDGPVRKFYEFMQFCYDVIVKTCVFMPRQLLCLIAC